MDATGRDARRCSSACAATACGSPSSLAASRPERVRGIVAFAVGVPKLSPPHAVAARVHFEEDLPTDEGWAKVNRHYWQRDYPGFARFFFSAIATEPHSTKVIDDAVGWAVDGSVDAMLASRPRRSTIDVERAEATCLAVRLSDAPRPRHRGPLPARSRARRRSPT